MNQKIRRCPRCKNLLNYEEFKHTNKEKFSEERIKQLWKSEYIQFYCCECYTFLLEGEFLTNVHNNPSKSCANCNKKVDFIQFRQTYNYHSVDRLISIWNSDPSNIFCQKCYNSIFWRKYLEKKKRKLYKITHGLVESEKQFIIDLVKQNCSLITRLNELKLFQDGFTVKNNHINTLVLSNSSLEEIPQSIGDLEFLEVLYLHSNEIRMLPHSIGKLKSLKKLRLDFNHLSVLPPSLVKLENLTELNLEGNRFTKVPKMIKNLTTLRYLDISKNPIKEIPHFLTDLTNLKILYTIGVKNKNFIKFIRNNMKEICLLVN